MPARPMRDSRRVGALSIVHRNNFAEMEENRGISLRPLVTELAAELRASAPEAARGLAIDLEMDTLHTTKMLRLLSPFSLRKLSNLRCSTRRANAVELSIRRTSELTARLSISSPVLVPEEEGDPENLQFERIVAGLAKNSYAPFSTESSAGTALICQCFQQPSCSC